MFVLRYLYLDQIETKKYKGYKVGNIEPSSFKNLETPRDVQNQKELDENEESLLKSYQACWDFLKNETFKLDAEEFLCRTGDYGSNPKEIVENRIKEFQMFLKNRYRYSKQNINSVLEIPFLYNLELNSFYKKWLAVRDEYLLQEGKLETQFVAFDDSSGIEATASIRAYNDALEMGLKSDLEEQETEYDLYYEVREPITNFRMNFLFLETLKCQVHKEGDSENKFFIDLEDIKSKMSGGDDLYVEDCESQDFIDFLGQKGLVYSGYQKGLENFLYYKFKQKNRR